MASDVPRRCLAGCGEPLNGEFHGELVSMDLPGLATSSEPRSHINLPLPPKANRGNRRRGYSRNRRTGPGVRSRALPWRRDPVVMRRVALVGRLVAQGYTRANQILPAVQAWAEAQREPPPSLQLVREDMRRHRVLASEEAGESVRDLLEALRYTRQQAWLAYHDPTLPLAARNKAEFLGTALRSAEAEVRYQHLGIAATLEERGMEIAERMAELMVTAVVEAVESLPLDVRTQHQIREAVADVLEIKVLDAKPARARLERDAVRRSV